MKILQLVQRPQLRGAEIFACQLTRELVSRGHEVVIGMLFNDGGALKELFPDLTFAPLGGNEKRRLLDFHTYRRLRDMIRSEGVDIVQANAGDTLKYAAMSRILYGWKAPLVFRNANLMSGFIRGRIHSRLQGLFLARCDNVISVSELCRRDLVGIFPAFEKRSETIPIGTYDFDDVAPVERPGDGPVIVNVSSFVPEKNHLLLVEIFAEYVNRHRRGRLWLVGDGRLRGEVEKRVADYDIRDRVVFWGATRSAVSILKAADVMLLTSRIEGLPGVILEAFACRVPVIASSVGGIPEVIENERTGFLAKNFEVTEFVSYLEKLTANRDLRDSIVTAARISFEEKFRMETVASRFLATYERILNKPHE